MGHYNSEMDHNSDQPRVSELILAEVDDDDVRALAAALFRSFNINGGYERQNSKQGVQVAHAIDELIKTRIEKTLNVDRHNIE